MPCGMIGKSGFSMDAKELRLPDALIAASAIVLNATVLSNDSHLRDYQRPGYTARATR